MKLLLNLKNSAHESRNNAVVDKVLVLCYNIEHHIFMEVKYVFRKIPSVVLCAIMLTALFCSCGDSAEKGSAANLPESSAVSSEASDEAFEESKADDKSFEITVPHVTGSFIQPWAFTKYTPSKWERHFAYLKEAGIDTIIMQWVVNDSNGTVTNAYYPCTVTAVENSSSSYMLEALLKACRKSGMKLFIGLNATSEWFSLTLSDRDWYIREAELGVKIAKEIHELYGEEYSDVICGWYFEHEFGASMGRSEEAAEFLNIHLDGLSEIGDGLPMLMSPYLESTVTAEDTGKYWTEVFSKTNFRKGDIFCSQDSLGVGSIPLYKFDDYYSAIRNAVETKPGLVLWANNENFTSTGKAATLDRFVRQLEISDKYAEKHICFSYSHYYAPDVYGSREPHEAYLNYIKTGEYEKPTPDEITYTGAKTLVSKGKSYKGAVSSRGDDWDDDKVKLTDGVIPDANGNDTAYFGTVSDGMSIVIDLGEVTEGLSEFSVSNTFGEWGVTNIESVTYYVSDDGEKWSQTGQTAHCYQQIPEAEYGSWLMYSFRVSLKEPVSGRYVKAVIENSGYMWISEIAVYTYDER